MVSGAVKCPTTGISIHWESNPETVFSRAGTGGSTGTSSEVPLEPEMLGPLGIRCWRSLSPLPCVYGVKESRGKAALDVGHVRLQSLEESCWEHRWSSVSQVRWLQPRSSFSPRCSLRPLGWLYSAEMVRSWAKSMYFLKYTHRKGFYIMGP